VAKKFYSEGKYEGKDGVRSQEAADSAMMGSARGFANMPQEVIMKTYPTSPAGMPENLDDTMKGIDSQMKKDNSKKMSHIQREKA